MNRPTKAVSRRAALSRLGGAFGAVYCSPIVTQLSAAQAASSATPPSAATAPTAASPVSTPTAASSPTSPSGSDEGDATGQANQDQGPSGCSAPSGSEGITISRRDMTNANNAVARGEAKPLREIFGIVQRRHPGQMIRVRFNSSADRNAYVIRMVTDSGSVQNVTVDALTGATLGIGAC